MRAALILVAVLGMAAPVAADGIYVSESVGGSNVKNELGQHLSDTMHIQLALGYRLNKSWAVEGFIAGDVGTAVNVNHPRPVAVRCIDCGNDGGGYEDPYYDAYGSELTTGGFAVKYIRPVSDNFEVYLRGQLGKGWMNDYEGRGFGVGAGAQLKGKVRALGFLFWPLFFVPVGPKVTASLFVDGGSDFYRLHRGGELDNPDAIDASISHLSIGWAVGADF